MGDSLHVPVIPTMQITDFMIERACYTRIMHLLQMHHGGESVLPLRVTSRSNYLHGNPKAKARKAKLRRLKAKGWLEQPDQHMVDWFIYKRHTIADRWQGITYGQSPAATVLACAAQHNQHVGDWVVHALLRLVIAYSAESELDAAALPRPATEHNHARYEPGNQPKRP